ncbi:uncharacterized protein LACBIDRAFT_301921 [Laccaria bicolor S238N-H82]|uniref:Predicted protein n=1 Tax=Laccaria bicolor (strain S238N-H82 / ATCC MYA-4686) TaxID=486041 RepID=B0CPX5_LACBS|nr:uncharacterized protein LACBIDRAFT_301921 [Laccaria bicolor S238N-H82]EDR16142.1 predicted protein [Laccaria bicolor S238N-H82]|eukprot:XP_001874350.1 predicted protein [Laccaria bicolor S238N-H82]
MGWCYGCGGAWERVVCGVRILKTPGSPGSRRTKPRAKGHRSLAIVLVHSYTYPEHKWAIGNLALSLGLTHVSESTQLLPMIKMVPCGSMSSTANMYLT